MGEHLHTRQQALLRGNLLVLHASSRWQLGIRRGDSHVDVAIDLLDDQLDDQLELISDSVS